MKAGTFSLLALEAVPYEHPQAKKQTKMAIGGNEVAVRLPGSGIFPVEVMNGHILKSWRKGNCREGQSSSGI